MGDNYNRFIAELPATNITANLITDTRPQLRGKSTSGTDQSVFVPPVKMAVLFIFHPGGFNLSFRK